MYINNIRKLCDLGSRMWTFIFDFYIGQHVNWNSLCTNFWQIGHSCPNLASKRFTNFILRTFNYHTRHCQWLLLSLEGPLNNCISNSNHKKFFFFWQTSEGFHMGQTTQIKRIFSCPLKSVNKVPDTFYLSKFCFLELSKK